MKMKRIIIILFLTAISFTGAYAQCMLKVSTTDKQAINVALDGRYFNKRGTSVTVGDLPAGNHYLQIYGVVRKRNGRLREAVIFEGEISTNNNMITLFVYDAMHGGTIQEESINSYFNEHPLPQGAPPVNNVDNNSSNNGNYSDNDNTPVASPVAVDNPGTLTDAKIDKLKTQSDAKKTDTDKLKIIRDGLKNEKVTTDNVAYIMDWLNFESTKIEFAKWAYDLTVDKENYNMLDAKFTYKNYQDEFTKFVNDKK